jgi:xanthine dehydrogenase accessory factor
MTRWLQALREVDEAGTPCVLVTVLAARGSTPREAGTKMVVTAETTHDSIGGGTLEFACIEHARALLDQAPGAPHTQDFALGPGLGQCCGGHTSVLFESFRPQLWRIAVFGAGHVGRALMGILGTLDCRVTWIDNREDAFPAAIASNVTVRRVEDPVALVRDLHAGTQVLVMTHEHALDFRIVEAALPRADLALVGVIGSQTKRARFVSQFARRGVGAETLARLVCPIGLPGVGGKPPGEIAVAVAAQLLQARDIMTHAPVPVPALAPTAEECNDCGARGCRLVEKADA